MPTIERFFFFLVWFSHLFIYFTFEEVVTVVVLILWFDDLKTQLSNNTTERL